MTTCNTCGMGLEPSDRFCMECGAPQPASPRPSAWPGQGPSQANVLANGQPRPSTTPNWLPPDRAPAATQRPAAPAKPTPPQEAPKENRTCPNCGALQPAGARFCGDCSHRLDAALPNPLSTLMAPPEAISARLPEPIPLPPSSLAPLLAAQPAQSVLPVYRLSERAMAPIPTPVVEPLDSPTVGNTAELPAISQAPLGAPLWQAPWQPGSSTGGPPGPNGVATPFPPSGWVATPNLPNGVAVPFPPNGDLAAPFPPTGGVATPILPSSGAATPLLPNTWTAGPLPPTSGSATPFPQQPFQPQRQQPYQAQGQQPFQPQGPAVIGGQPTPAVPPWAPVPGAPAGPRRGQHPRGQVRTMIVAGIISLVATIAGVVWQFFLTR